MRLGFLFVICFASWVSLALAENINFYAEVDTDKIPLDSVGRLSLTITGTQTVTQIPILTVDGFEVKYLGPATRISIINGQTFASHTYRYSLYPLKVGKFQIPSISIDIGGKTYSTKPMDIEVVEAGAPIGPPPASQQVEGSPTGLQGKIFATMTTPKREVYVGERIPVTIRLFVSGLSVTDIEYPKLEELGFSVREFQEPRQYQQIIGGNKYDVLEFNTDIYPTREGEISLGKAKIKCQMLYRTKRGERLPFDDFDSFFDDDFFDSFLSFYERRPLNVESTDLSINVLPLPAAGKPEDFKGAIGRFDFEVSVSPSEVHVGDPITVRMKIRGDNLKSLLPPALKADGFKTYDPQVKEEDNTKTIEQVVIPTNDQVKELPAIRFSYFNPETKAYETITKGPFPLQVKKAAGQDFKVVGLDKKEEERIEEVLGRDILFIKEDPQTFRRVGQHLFHNVWFRFMFHLLAAGWLIAYGLYRHTHKLKTDTVYARRLLAPRKAKRGLTQSRVAMARGQQAEFYQSIFKTLKEYLGDKFHLPSAGLTFETVQHILESKSIDHNQIQMIHSVFEDCDMARYAAIQFDSTKMQDVLKRAEKVIDYLERSVK